MRWACPVPRLTAFSDSRFWRRFRLEIDLTQDRMTWTRLNHEPRDPPVPKLPAGGKPAAPAGVQAMNTLGSFAKGLAFFLGKQPEDEHRPRGFLGIEWTEHAESGHSEVEVSRVLAGSPAEAGGLRTGDRIKKINDQAIDTLKSARAALAEAQTGERIAVLVRRATATGRHEEKLTLTVGEGL